MIVSSKRSSAFSKKSVHLGKLIEIPSAIPTEALGLVVDEPEAVLPGLLVDVVEFILLVFLRFARKEFGELRARLKLIAEVVVLDLALWALIALLTTL